MLESGLLADAGDRYELSGPLPPLAIPTTLARFADGAARPPRPGQGGGADRRRDRPRVLPRAACRGRRRCPRPTSSAALDQLVALRAGLPPRRAARGDLQLQARAGPGRRLPVAAQDPSASSCTPGSPRRSKERFPDAAETEPELLAQHLHATRAWRSGRSPIGAAPASWPPRVRRTWKRSLTSARGSSWSERCPRPRSSSTRNWACGWRSVVHSWQPRAMRLQRLSGPIAGRGRCANSSADRTELFPVLRGLWTNHLLRGEFRRAHDLAERLVVLADEERALLRRAHACRALGSSLFA